MSDDQRLKVEPGLPFGWLSLWLFTVGFADLGFGGGVLALLLWPLYLGDAALVIAQ